MPTTDELPEFSQSGFHVSFLGSKVLVSSTQVTTLPTFDPATEAWSSLQIQTPTNSEDPKTPGGHDTAFALGDHLLFLSDNLGWYGTVFHQVTGLFEALSKPGMLSL